VLFTIANVGETRGTIVCSLVGVEIVDELTERPFLLGSVEMHNDLGIIALGPGEHRILHIPEGKHIPKWDPDMFGRNPGPGNRNSPKTIHLHGQIIYTDAAGINRRTAFRRVLKPERQRFYRIEYEPDLDYSD
jgi:hypothetical protein